MTDDEREKLYQKLGPDLVDNNPHVSQAFNAICEDQPAEDVFCTTIRVLAAQRREVEDRLALLTLKAKPWDVCKIEILEHERNKLDKCPDEHPAPRCDSEGMLYGAPCVHCLGKEKG